MLMTLTNISFDLCNTFMKTLLLCLFYRWRNWDSEFKCLGVRYRVGIWTKPMLVWPQNSCTQLSHFTNIQNCYYYFWKFTHIQLLTSSVMAYNTLISEYLLNTYYVLDTRPDAKKDPDNYLTCFLFSRRLQSNQGNNKIIDHWKQYAINMNRPAWAKATAEMCVLWDKEGQESG